MRWCSPEQEQAATRIERDFLAGAITFEEYEMQLRQARIAVGYTSGEFVDVSPWSERNPARWLQYQRAWRARNPDKVKAANRKYRRLHPELVAERARNWRTRNPDYDRMANRRRKRIRLGLDPDDPRDLRSVARRRLGS